MNLIINIPLYNPVGSYQNYIYPLVLIMILHQTMLIGIGMICGTLREKMRGTTIRTHKGKAELYGQTKQLIRFCACLQPAFQQYPVQTHC